MSVQVKVEEGLLLLKTGATDKAEAIFREAATQHPDQPLVHYYLGLVLAKNDKTAEAEPVLSNAARLSGAPAHWLALGKVRLSLGMASSAAQAFRAAIEAGEGDQARAGLGLARLAEGNFTEAEEIFSSLIQAWPHEPQHHFRLAQTLARQGRFAEAEASFLKALELSPTTLEYYVEMAEAALRSGNFEAIAGAVAPLIDLDQATFEDLTQRLGDEAFQRGRFQWAELFFSRLIENAPDNVNYLYNMAKINGWRGDFEAAELYLDKAQKAHVQSTLEGKYE